MTRIRLEKFMSFVMLTLVLGVASVHANALTDALASVKIGSLGSFEMTPSSGGLSETVLYNFQGSADGANPWNLTPGPNGSFYGVTAQGGHTGNGCGTAGCGVVFELTPSSGGWTEQVIHTFIFSDGSDPYKGLVKDSHGNLYGTATNGGSSNRGTVFELIPPATPGGMWRELTLHNFGVTNSDGWYPVGPLYMDANGNLFGVTDSNPVAPYTGTIFELSPSATNGWSEQILYKPSTQTGIFPNSGLITDAPGVNNPNEPARALYGTMESGGSSGHNSGTVFQLVPSTSPVSPWVLNVLYTFTGSSDGGNPEAGLYMDSNGNLFGTAVAGGGPSNAGTAFELSPSAQPGGSWTYNVIHTFTDTGGDGYQPQTAPIADSSGALYIPTVAGGSQNVGTVVKLTQSGNSWSETILYNFHGSDGYYPEDLMLGPGGTLYGTTRYGGSHNQGVVFQLQ